MTQGVRSPSRVLPSVQTFRVQTGRLDERGRSRLDGRSVSSAPRGCRSPFLNPSTLKSALPQRPPPLDLTIPNRRVMSRRQSGTHDPRPLLPVDTSPWGHERDWDGPTSKRIPGPQVRPQTNGRSRTLQTTTERETTTRFERQFPLTHEGPTVGGPVTGDSRTFARTSSPPPSGGPVPGTRLFPSRVTVARPPTNRWVPTWSSHSRLVPVQESTVGP